MAKVDQPDALKVQMRLSANDKTKNYSLKQLSENSNSYSKYITIEVWRRKKGEPMIYKDGKTWHWSPKHMSQLKYNG